MSRIPGWTNVSSLALRLVLFAGVALCAQLAGPAWAGVIYVRGDAAGTKTGLSWANAYTNPQAGLAAAEWGDEIWVAKGTYKPTTGTLRTVSFALEAGVGLYGGFAGAETELGQRNWKINATILSGDIGTTGSAGDNSYHVVVGAYLTVLDGFTITGGTANGSGSSTYGGGMYNSGGSPTVTNCTFSGNTASGGSGGSGGGMYNKDRSPTVTDCTFCGNTGGGMWNYGSGSPTVTNCTFSGNTGGGMSNFGSGSPTVTNCTFNGNSGSWGGGMYNYAGSPTVTNCTFTGNTAAASGGGIDNSGGSPTVTNCAFTGNTALYCGGGMYNYAGSPTVTNCTFSGNTASGNRADYGDGGGMYNFYSSPTVTNCTFSGNTGRGMSNFGSGSPTVTNCTFNGNNGGGMWNYVSGSPTVTNCAFTGNTARVGGGMCNEDSSAIVTNCTFSDNTASGFNASGGGMYNGRDDSSIISPTVTNCTFSRNTADYGGAMYNDWCPPDVTNCTFSGNTAAWDGGGMYNHDRGIYNSNPSSPIVTNCTFSGNTANRYGGGMYNLLVNSPDVANSIFWGDTAPLGAEIYKGGTGTPTFTHCDIRGSGGSGALWNPALGADGGGNIMSDPRFVAPAAPAGPDGLWRTGDDGLRLQSDSPCIGAADPAVAPQTDILGLPRSSPPDIGAYEFLSMPPARAHPVWRLFR